MDAGERTLLGQSLATFCARNAPRLDAMEHGRLDGPGWTRLHDELEALGVLSVLGEAGTRDELATVAEAAGCLAARSPSLALLVAQQNLAARLRLDAGAGPPTGWIALPLYDSPAEWPAQVQVAADGPGFLVDGTWGSIPGLPIASSVLLPLASAPADPDAFALVELELAPAPAGLARGAAARTLGLRGCPVADLSCDHLLVPEPAIRARGAPAARAVETLWSQAEVLMLAIRAGILEQCYAVARDYAQVRWQGRKIIREHSLVQRMLADLYGARCAVNETWRELGAALVADAPLTAGQLGRALGFADSLPRLASDGIQILGGYGYMEELGQERRFRDAKQCELLLGHPQAKRFSSFWREPR